VDASAACTFTHRAKLLNGLTEMNLGLAPLPYVRAVKLIQLLDLNQVIQSLSNSWKEWSNSGF
jgi:hypothetical protein